MPECGGNKELWKLRARSTQFPLCLEFPSPAEALRKLQGSLQTDTPPVSFRSLRSLARGQKKTGSRAGRRRGCGQQEHELSTYCSAGEGTDQLREEGPLWSAGHKVQAHSSKLGHLLNCTQQRDGFVPTYRWGM